MVTIRTEAMNTPIQLVRLFETGRHLVYEKDDVIVHPGDIPSGVYYIVSGAVKAYSLCLDGEPNIIVTLCHGEIFPVAWAVNEASRDMGFETIDRTVVLRVPREDFLQAVTSDSQVAHALMQSLAGHISRLAGEIDNLQYRSAREKVVYRLIFLADHFGQENGSSTTINMRITNDYIARSTNMTRETASRELSRLNRKGLIYADNGRIVIPDVSLLSREISRNFNPATLSLD